MGLQRQLPTPSNLSHLCCFVEIVIINSIITIIIGTIIIITLIIDTIIIVIIIIVVIIIDVTNSLAVEFDVMKIF